VHTDIKQEIYALHAGLCKALADPKRLLIIEALRGGSVTVGDLAIELGLSQSNVSQHLAILRDRGVVVADRSGNNVYYRLGNPKVLAAIDILREVMAEQLASRGELHRAATSA
jgi:ArsR family transcriptional regulator, virulence genes transcriptional regulator